MDLNAVAVARRRSHLPVIADPSHATGKWYLVPSLSLASVAAGADGLMIEAHPDPDRAVSDGGQSLTLENFAALMPRVAAVAAAVDRGIAR
jgi:3-deoxy-7-phosphoheptulonate synthase